MGRVETIVSDDLENKFRAKASKKFGMKRGSLAKGLEAAMALWLEQSDAGGSGA